MIPKRKMKRLNGKRAKLIWKLKKQKQQDRIVLELMDEVREYKLCG